MLRSEPEDLLIKRESHVSWDPLAIPALPSLRRSRKEDCGKFEATLAYSEEEEEEEEGEEKRGRKRRNMEH